MSRFLEHKPNADKRRQFFEKKSNTTPHLITHFLKLSRQQNGGQLCKKEMRLQVETDIQTSDLAVMANC